MIKVTRKEKFEEIYNIKRCLFMMIEIVPYERKKNATQCYRCNYFNHSSKNCSTSPRCLKCGKNYNTRDCTVKEKRPNSTCISCKQTGHIASWEGRPRFPKPKKGTPTLSTRKNKEFTSTPIRKNTKYADVCNTDIENQENR
ncbi:nucleic-acid-binding protein from transposon X-element [Nephila pilipes]|uniref:Nucleic-acid-binding protein from transposon X-element n=1 Tax=Nephila pilipes TaxID=299642 RepID=A0A8X6PPL1_NEPPI|nr:nucleic-acid-binding protein from transposon X-element [Nephila pilipes]